MGDVMWYFTGILNRLDTTIDDVLKINIDKLNDYFSQQVDLKYVTPLFEFKTIRPVYNFTDLSLFEWPTLNILKMKPYVDSACFN